MVESQVSIWPRLKCLSGLAPAFSWNDFSCHRNNVLHVSCLNSPRLCFSLTLWMAIFLAKSPHLLKIQHFESDWGRVPRRLQSLGTSNLRFGERHLGLQDSLLMTWMLVDSCFKTSETSLTLLQGDLRKVIYLWNVVFGHSLFERQLSESQLLQFDLNTPKKDL